MALVERAVYRCVVRRAEGSFWRAAGGAGRAGSVDK